MPSVREEDRPAVLLSTVSETTHKRLPTGINGKWGKIEVRRRITKCDLLIRQLFPAPLLPIERIFTDDCGDDTQDDGKLLLVELV